MSEIAEMKLTHQGGASSTEKPWRCERDVAKGGRRERDLRDERCGPFGPGDCPRAGYRTEHGALACEPKYGGYGLVHRSLSTTRGLAPRCFLSVRGSILRGGGGQGHRAQEAKRRCPWTARSWTGRFPERSHARRLSALPTTRMCRTASGGCGAAAPTPRPCGPSNW